jgi:hypothetical protein
MLRQNTTSSAQRREGARQRQRCAGSFPCPSASATCIATGTGGGEGYSFSPMRPIFCYHNFLFVTKGSHMAQWLLSSWFVFFAPLCPTCGFFLAGPHAAIVWYSTLWALFPNNCDAGICPPCSFHCWSYQRGPQIAQPKQN